MNPSYELMDRAREEYARKGVLRQEYHRGFEAGKRARTPEQWQLDMERMEVARRVDSVTLDNGSHGNLSAIASAIYEPKFGWTSGACAMLRQKLVRLLGGTHERDCRGGRDDIGAPRPDNSDGEQAEEVMQSELVNCGNPYKAGGAVLDSGIIVKTINLGYESDSEHMENGEGHRIATITDELRKHAKTLAYPHNDRLRAIADRIDAQFNRICELWERTAQDAIYMHLNAEEETDELLELLRDAAREYQDKHHWAQVWHDRAEDMRMERDELQAKLDELSGHSRTCPESDEEVSESAPPATITGELRVWAHGLSDPWKLSVEAPLLAIADRIDEQFRRICEQHEAVLQSTIDEMGDELDDLTANNGELAAKCGELQERVLQSVIEQMADENLTVKDERDYLRKQRDELQAKLDKIAGVLDGRD